MQNLDRLDGSESLHVTQASAQGALLAAVHHLLLTQCSLSPMCDRIEHESDRQARSGSQDADQRTYVRPGDGSSAAVPSSRWSIACACRQFVQRRRLQVCAGSPATLHSDAAGMTSARRSMGMTAAVAAAVLMRHAPGAALYCTASQASLRGCCLVSCTSHGQPPQRESCCSVHPGRRRSPDEQLRAGSREADRERAQPGGLPGRDRDHDPDRDTDHRRRTHDTVDWERHRGSAEEYDRDRDWRDGSRKRGRPGESVRDADRDRCLISSQVMTKALL